MFRKKVDPRAAALVTLVTVLAVQAVYWRLLVYVPRSERPRGAGGGGGGPREEEALLGLDAVRVENWVGDEPGYQDGPAWKARFSGPNALALLPNGELAIADSRNHCLRQVMPTGMVSTLAGGAFTGTGGDALGPAGAAGFRYPSGVAVGTDGALYVSDTGNHRICRIAEGAVTLLAGGSQGHADGLGAQAKFDHPGPCAVDHQGVLWVLDAGNRRLRSITREGLVSTPATTPPEIRGVLSEVLASPPAPIWSVRNRESEPTISRHRVKRIGSAAWLGNTRIFGDVARHVLLMQRPGQEPILLAGRINPVGDVTGDEEGPGNRCSFATPAAVAASKDGTVYVADYEGNRIRRVRVPVSLLQR